MTRPTPTCTTASPPDAAVTQGDGAHRDAIVQLLHDALAAELLCLLRGKRLDGVRSAQIHNGWLH